MGLMSSESTVLSSRIVQNGIAEESGDSFVPLLRSTPEKGRKSELPGGLAINGHASQYTDNAATAFPGSTRPAFSRRHAAGREYSFLCTNLRQSMRVKSLI